MADETGVLSDNDKAIPKQAVIVVHGIGEEKPLETIRDFVNSVYRADPAMTGETDDKYKKALRPGADVTDNITWIVPDAATGSAELRRITTPMNKARIRTDFYEFYWADVMEGTPVQLALDWVQSILLRSPANVPPRIRIWLAWLLLWLLALVTLALAIFTFAPTNFQKEFTGVVLWIAANRVWIAWVLGVLGALVFFLNCLGAKRAGDVRLTGPLVLVGLALVVAFVPVELAGNVRIWAAIVSFLGAAIFTGLVGPYVGDVARYVRATPATIAKRRTIRERGLKLLREIHGKRAADGLPEYDRVVIVGHSLGCIIAYDLLMRFWDEAGPDHDVRVGANGALWDPKAEPGVVAALNAVDAVVQKVWPAPDGAAQTQGFDLTAYQDAQGALFKALAKSSLNWRISDFITLGSPLAHADFLMVDSATALDAAFAERQFAASPPRPDWPERSMLYNDWANKRGPFAHFAAPFATVKWTNIYDYHWLPLFGDIVSGELAPQFGPGIAQHDVPIMRAHRPPVLNRLFTHTLYWALGGKQVPKAMTLLREALDLGGDVAKHTRKGLRPAKGGAGAPAD